MDVRSIELPSATSRTAGFTKFMDLPLELREIIYSAYFSLHSGEIYIKPSSTDITMENSSPQWPQSLPRGQNSSNPVSLVLVSRAVYDEAVPISLQDTRFRFCSLQALAYFLSSHTTNHHRVRRIILDQTTPSQDDQPSLIDALIRSAALLPSLHSLCVYYSLESLYQRSSLMKEMGRAIPRHFTLHAIKPSNVYVLDPELEAYYAGHVRAIAQGWLALGQTTARRWELPLDKMTDRVRDALSADRGVQSTGMDLSTLRWSRTVDAVMRFKHTAKAIQVGDLIVL